MRLPDGGNPKLIELEDARQFHERLYENYLFRGELGLLDNDSASSLHLEASERGAKVDLVKLSGNLHRFWAKRGFKLRCKCDKEQKGIYVWLTLRAKARVEQAA